MFKFFINFLLVLALSSVACHPETDSGTEDKSVKIDSSRPPAIKFKREIIDFGTLREGEKAELVFIYTNTGGLPLKIISVESDCGCTLPEWSKEALYPGDTARLKALFDSEGFRGNIIKTVSIKTNDGNTHKLRIGGYIDSPIKLKKNNR